MRLLVQKNNLYTLFPILFVLIFTFVGFIFRYQGIEKELSYWNDENQVALMSRGILWYGKAITENGSGGGVYQIGLYYLTALSFIFFGITEFAGRLPSVLAGTLSIPLIYFVTKKMVGQTQAIVAAFFMAFSQMQLAWSTQLRPYIYLELVTLLVCFFSYKYLENKKDILDKNLFFGLAAAFLGSFFHGTALLNFIFISLILIYKIFKLKKYKFLLILFPIGLAVLFFVYFSLSGALSTLLYFKIDLLHYRIYLTHEYWWLVLGALLGTGIAFFKNRNFFITTSILALLIFVIAIFKLNSHYVRYSLPAFPLMYILFAYGISTTASFVAGFIKGGFLKALVFNCLIISILGLVFLTGKVVFSPQYYYSINADMRENPIVDYKEAFRKIREILKDKNNTIVMDAWNDRVPYYLPGQKFVFLYKEGKGDIDPVYGEKMIGSIKDFEEEKKRYRSGVVIIEDWPSLTPPELQEHLRKTLKHEFDVRDLPFNTEDHWSISVYSWGL